MKKKLIIIALVYFGVCFNNSKNNPTDYRDIYCGNYNCKRIYSSIGVRDTSNVIVYVAKHAQDSVLKITTNEGEFMVKLENLKFKGINKRCFGNLIADSLYFTNIPSLAPISYRYFGKK